MVASNDNPQTPKDEPMIFCTAHRPDRYVVRLPSQIAVTEPRRRAPVRTVRRPGQVYTDWASI